MCDRLLIISYKYILYDTNIEIYVEVFPVNIHKHITHVLMPKMDFSSLK